MPSPPNDTPPPAPPAAPAALDERLPRTLGGLALRARLTRDPNGEVPDAERRAVDCLSAALAALGEALQATGRDDLRHAISEPLRQVAGLILAALGREQGP